VDESFEDAFQVILPREAEGLDEYRGGVPFGVEVVGRQRRYPEGGAHIGSGWG